MFTQPPQNPYQTQHLGPQIIDGAALDAMRPAFQRQVAYTLLFVSFALSILGLSGGTTKALPAADPAFGWTTVWASHLAFPWFVIVLFLLMVGGIVGVVFAPAYQPTALMPNPPPTAQELVARIVAGIAGFGFACALFGQVQGGYFTTVDLLWSGHQMHVSMGALVVGIVIQSVCTWVEWGWRNNKKSLPYAVAIAFDVIPSTIAGWSLLTPWSFWLGDLVHLPILATLVLSAILVITLNSLIAVLPEQLLIKN